MDSWALVFACVDFASASRLRLCCKAFSANSFLCRAVAKQHFLYSSLVAGPGGTRDDIGSGNDELRAVLSLSTKFQDATSLSAFSAPIQSLGDGPMSVVDLRRHRSSGCYVAIKS